MNAHSSPPPEFYRDLAILLGERAPIKQCLLLMAAESSRKKVRKFASIWSVVEDEADSDFLNSCPFKLEAVAREALRHADRATTIPVLFDLADGLETERTLGRRVLIALAYPCAILFLYLSLLFFVQIAVIPVFREMYEGFGSQLPTSTSIVLNYSKYVSLALVFVVAMLVRPIREWILRRLPVFRTIFKNADTMRAARTCFLLRRFVNDHGRILQTTLEPFGGSRTDNVDQFIREKGLFSKLSWRSIKNSQNPSTGLMLSDLIRTLEHRHRNLVDRAAVISQVVSMILVALLIGSIVFAVMTPIFQLSSVIQ